MQSTYLLETVSYNSGLGFGCFMKGIFLIYCLLQKYKAIYIYKALYDTILKNEKSRIRETLNLSTDADSRTDTIFLRFIMSLCTYIFRKDERPRSVTMYYILCTMSTMRQGYVYTMYYVYYKARPRNVTVY